jgi:predicted O-methyltransferase YrrM
MRLTLARIKSKLIRTLLPPPVRTVNWEYSGIYYAEQSPPSELLDLALQAAQMARTLDLHWIDSRLGPTHDFFHHWPGEHYRFLAGLMTVLQPKLVVELGTYQGLASLTLKHHVPGRVVTFDVIPWNKIENTILRQEDFDERLEQRLKDVSQPDVAEEQAPILREADFIFVDALKDGRMEQRFIDNFRTIRLKPGTPVLFDDIRVWNMLRIWQSITEPKIDLTSLAHWSGTGLVRF